MNDPVGEADAMPLELPAAEGKTVVLLVDDDESIRDLGTDILHLLGYGVNVACDGGEALAMIQRTPDRFDIVISDLRMPELNGRELAAEVRKNHSGLPFILITGFDYDMDEGTLDELGISEVVQKPFHIADIEQAIRRALGGQPG